LEDKMMKNESPLYMPDVLDVAPRFNIGRGRENAYRSGHAHGTEGLYHACPYPAGSSYSAAYQDGFYDGRHGDE
jgi:hypothetical protein